MLLKLLSLTYKTRALRSLKLTGKTCLFFVRKILLQQILTAFPHLLHLVFDWLQSPLEGREQQFSQQLTVRKLYSNRHQIVPESAQTTIGVLESVRQFLANCSRRVRANNNNTDIRKHYEAVYSACNAQDSQSSLK